MKYRKRIYYTETDKALMWDRWQNAYINTDILIANKTSDHTQADITVVSVAS